MNTKKNLASRLFASTIAITLVLAIVPATPAFAGAPMCIPGDHVELGLGIDVSGSIVPADFTLQKNAYLSVLAGLPVDGSVSIGVWQFDDNIAVVHATSTINSVADRNALLTDITNNLAHTQGLTALAGVISTISTDLSTNGIASDRQVIDISTDGVDTVGGDPDQAAMDAVNNDGIEQVNALGIGVMPSFNFGTGSFSVEVDTFADFEAALEGKIMTEICDDPTVAGELLPIDTTALFVSGAAANAGWLLPVIAGIAGTAFYLTRSRWNFTSEE